LGIIPLQHAWIPDDNGHVKVEVADFRSSKTEDEVTPFPWMAPIRAI
jgi:hypothetical protein